MIVNVIKNLLADSLHGGVLKLLALLARVGFLIYVLPGLPSGELTAYVYINSVALLVATFAIFGLNDELPRVIRNEPQLARHYSSAFFALNISACLVFAILWLAPTMLIAIAAYALSVLSSRLLGGLIRSFDPSLNEHLQNLPWVLFLPLVLLLRPESAFDLVALMVVCQLAVQWYCAVYALRGHTASSASEAQPLFSMLRQSGQRGVAKQISNLCLLGVMRSPVLWPVWLGCDMNLDGIAFAVAAGEIIAQFGLIPVNRAYSRWCRAAPVHLEEWRRAVHMGLTWWLMLVTVGVSGILLAAKFGWLPDFPDVQVLLLQAVCLYAFIPVFRLLRYLLWARALLPLAIVLISATLFVAAGVTIATVPLTQWLSVILVTCAIGWAGLAALARPLFPPKVNVA